MFKIKKNKIIVYKRNFDFDGNLKSVLQYVKPERKNYRSMIPFWLLILIGIGMTAIAIILISGWLIKFLVPLPALFNKTCIGRSCTAGLGMKCIDGLCQCTEGYFYAKGCQKKKNRFDKCNTDSSCYENSLDCIDGTCQCNSSMLWDEKTATCLIKKSYGGRCTTDLNCMTSQMLKCNINVLKCLCPSNR